MSAPGPESDARRSRRVLGIDPGTRVAGWGVTEESAGELRLVAAGVVRASAELPPHERLVLIYDGMGAVLREHAVDLVAIEESFFGKNVHSALRLGEGRAVAMLAAVKAGKTLVELAPSLVKKAVTGHGNATKEQVRAAVEMMLAPRGSAFTALEGLPLDASDALALSIAAHARSSSAVPFARSPRGRRSSRGKWTLADVSRLSTENGP